MYQIIYYFFPYIYSKKNIFLPYFLKYYSFFQRLLSPLVKKQKKREKSSRKPRANNYRINTEICAFYPPVFYIYDYFINMFILVLKVKKNTDTA